MKKQLTALAILSMLAAPVTAQSLDNQAFEAKVFHTEAATKANTQELAELSRKEMTETEGAWVANAIGGFAGMYGGGYGYLAAGGKDPRGFFVAAASGAAAGVFSPVTGIRSGAMALGSGLAGGYVGSRLSQ